MPPGTGHYPTVEWVRLLSGRYRLTERLGTGGMSVVWRAYDEVLGRAVAVKVLAPELAADPLSRARIRAEAQAAGRLSHPHITAVHDYGESEVDGAPVPYVVMELVDGYPLDVRLEHGSVPWPEAVLICAQLASALAAVHARGLVHRDVKPANVMLTPGGAKLVDFGISAVAGDLADAGPDNELLGTPAYLAPERLDGAPTTPASDVYALGLLLYRMLAGGLPFQVQSTTEMLTAHYYLPPSPLPEVAGLPPEIAELCTSCLAKAPDARPSAFQAAQLLGAAVLPIEAIDTVQLRRAAVGRVSRPALLRELADSATRAVSGLRHRVRTRTGRASAGLLGALATAFVLMATCAGPPEPAVSQQLATADDPAAAGRHAEARVGCLVRYATRTDASGAFVVDVNVLNNGARAVPAWQLAFAFPGNQRIVEVTPATWSQRGNEVTVADGTAALGAGEQITLTLTGAYQGANPMPTAFSLNDIACQSLVVGASQQPVAPPAANTGGTGAGSDDRSGRGGGKGSGKDGSGKGRDDDDDGGDDDD